MPDAPASSQQRGMHAVGRGDAELIVPFRWLRNSASVKDMYLSLGMQRASFSAERIVGTAQEGAVDIEDLAGVDIVALQLGIHVDHEVGADRAGGRGIFDHRHLGLGIAEGVVGGQRLIDRRGAGAWPTGCMSPVVAEEIPGAAAGDQQHATTPRMIQVLRDMTPPVLFRFSRCVALVFHGATAIAAAPAPAAPWPGLPGPDSGGWDRPAAAGRRLSAAWARAGAAASAPWLNLICATAGRPR